jgi:hypothetical protein
LIAGQGNLSTAPCPDAPLLVVFGGITFQLEGWDRKRASGDYMWEYGMNQIRSRFHIFVACNDGVNGAKAYSSLMSKLPKHLTPSTQILYLFSGGCRPGMDLLLSDGSGRLAQDLSNSYGPNLFSSIYLVDIFLKEGKHRGISVPAFYMALADTYATKITYVYTEAGAANKGAREYIKERVCAIKVTGIPGMKLHMSTNAEAINALPQ